MMKKHLWYYALVVLLVTFSAAHAVEPALTFPVVDTGQTRCYDDRGGISCPQSAEAFYGQDAQYQGYAPQYAGNGDGTVTDQITGLMWQKAFTRVSWADALSAATGDRTGGYTDWRVPTIKELYSLINFNGATGTVADPNTLTVPEDAAPYLDTTVFDFEYPTSTGRYIDAQYVTGTEYVSTVFDGAACFFGVNFADGRIKCYPKRAREGQLWYARYVRGRETYGTNDFQDNGDGTIRDRATGLTWMQVDSGDDQFAGSLSRYARQDGSMNWEEALDFCEELSVAGQDDWRLPNAKELQSIVDYTRSPDTTNSAAIAALFETTAIQDEGGNLNYPFFWSSTTLLDGLAMGTDAVIVAFGEALGKMSLPNSQESTLMDVHGAGAQRSDPKSGTASMGGGPQGDVRRVYNYVRCVHGGDVFYTDETEPPLENAGGSTLPLQGGQQESPPPEAMTACRNSQSGDLCSFESPHGTISGKCRMIESQQTCVPEDGPQP